MNDIFVGRVECTENLKVAWNHGQNRIFGIYGPKSVGKTRYVENFLRILRTSDKNDQVKVLALDFHCIKSFKVYVETVAGCLSIEDCEACSHTNCRCIRKIIKSLKDSEDVYIFHHDHQEEAKSKPDSDGNLTDSTNQTLWDQIYAEGVKPLLTECSNFYLIISSTDEFRFAELRRVFWMQKIPALTESESMELLNDVWPSCTEDAKLCRQLILLCDGIPPAIINAGLLMEDNVISVDVVIKLMVKQIIEVLSDEFLPHPERINTQLQNRWKHLSEEQSDNLVKTLVIIKYTSQSTIAANAKLFKCNNVAEYKFNHLLPLLRRNLLSYNKDSETVSPYPLIQHILEAVNYIKADEIREGLQEQIKAILEPQSQNGASSCKSLSLSPNFVDLPNDPCTCPQNSFPVANRANPCAFQGNIYQEPSHEKETLRTRGQRVSSFKAPVENENFEKPTNKSYGGNQVQEIRLDDSADRTCNPECRQNSLITKNLNRRSLEKDKSYECKDIFNTGFSLSPEHMPLEIKQSQLNNIEKNNHETCPTFPQENEEIYQSIDENTSLSSEHSGDLISRGPNVSQSGKSQTISSIDKSNLGPDITLSGEYETRTTEKPDDSSALPFPEKSTPNLQKHYTDQYPDVTLSGVGSISKEKSGIQLSSSYSSENTQDCLRSGADKGQGVTTCISGIAASCVHSSPNVRKDNTDQGPYVTISGVYQTINSENEILTKDLRERTVSKSEDKVANIQGQSIPRIPIVPKSPVQVSEEADGVNCTFVKGGFSCPHGHLHTTAVGNETGIPSRNVSSNYSGDSNIREGSTHTNNMGFIMHLASPSEETVPRSCLPSSLNNQKFNYQNSSSKIETSTFCQSTKEATGIPCKMGTENLSGLRHRPQNHSKTSLEDNTKQKGTQESQSTIVSAESNVNALNANGYTCTPQTLMASGNTTYREHENLSSEESVSNLGATGSTENENPACEDHDSGTSINSSFFSKAFELYKSLE
ncbi:uncharacterized protein LOC133178453 [Saccostrea echinata]|uniref:uncharacterized protein LOC133178453 n=1 Tax=Saccostrea echinata TaxID=191078 RepID=UPI002A80DE59|nr:uncharacterized protein LOC133178453 [Saccostrea echinata]